MKRSDLMDKLEKMAAGMRQELDRNEGSTLQTISGAFKQGYESLKSGIERNERAQKILDGLRQSMDEVSQAVMAGDRKLSTKALEALEKRIKEYKARQDEEDDQKPTEDSVTKQSEEDGEKPAKDTGEKPE